MLDEILASHMTTVCLQSFLCRLCRMDCATLETLLQSNVSVVSVKREFPLYRVNSIRKKIGQWTGFKRGSPE